MLLMMSVLNLIVVFGDLCSLVFGFWGMDDCFNLVGGVLIFFECCCDVCFVLMNCCGYWVMVEYVDYFNWECFDFFVVWNM